jgi:(R,R)-butanediol dehydrogenase/meso-butanediol dehydrogenase/diacetyl reductase
MKAAVTDQNRSVEISERERPIPGGGQLLISVDASGICGSDLRMVDLSVAGNVLGHEFTGTVVELGSGVNEFAVGDRVCSVPFHTCQQCVYCLSGDPAGCSEAKFVGGHRDGKRVPGSFAEMTVVDAVSSLRVPDSVTRDQAALVEPLSVALKVVERARFQSGDKLLLLGAGPIGLAVLLWARTNGVGRILVSDPVASRRELALRLGASRVVDPTSRDVGEFFAESFGAAPEVVIDCVGRAGMFDQALKLAANDGRVVIAGMHMGNDEFYMREPFLKNLTISFCALYTKAHYEHTLQMLASGQLDPTPMITHRIGLDELPDTLAALRAPNEFGKVLVLST